MQFPFMERKIESEFGKWKDEPHRRALLVTGCRQIGKTYSITEFAKAAYDNVIYINFEAEPEYLSLFSEGMDASSILHNLGFTKFGRMMVPGKTVIIFDEIQSCAKAFSALKSLVIDGRFDYIASGSLLGVELADELMSPMGYVKILRMYPMDFEEFLWANGIGKEQTESIRSRISSRIPFDEFQLSKLHELFRNYLVIGGMPGAVSIYIESGNYAKVTGVFDDILYQLRRDSMRYSPKHDRMRISACFDSVPEQLAKENNTFSYYDIEQIRGAGRNIYGSSIDWLIGSGVVSKVSNLSEPREPLKRNTKVRSFKIYSVDTGILVYMMGPNTAERIIRGNGANNGAVMENAVHNMLLQLGYDLYFFQKSNSTLEVDFVFNYNGAVTAIEVKSGRYDYPKSLITVMSDRYGVEKGILLSADNISTDSHGVLHLPLFAPAFFEPLQYPDLPAVDDIERLNAELGGTERWMYAMDSEDTAADFAAIRTDWVRCGR